MGKKADPSVVFMGVENEAVLSSSIFKWCAIRHTTPLQKLYDGLFDNLFTLWIGLAGGALRPPHFPEFERQICSLLNIEESLLSDPSFWRTLGHRSQNHREPKTQFLVSCAIR